MSTQDIAAALERVTTVFSRRPEVALGAESSAHSKWTGGFRVMTAHPNGLQVATDMAAEVGGTGDQFTPGWLFRAGMAACTTTMVLIVAAQEGIELDELDVRTHSRNDARGMFGVPGEAGESIDATPRDIELHVRVRAAGVSAERLRALVQAAFDRSPVSLAVVNGPGVALNVDAGDAS